MPNVFVAPPGWSWDIVLYFFFGGLAGGCYFIACMLRIVGAERDRRLSRIGFYLVFPLVNVSALLLIKDLGVPERFTHMLMQSERIPFPIFKWYSPISFGSWIVALSGVMPLISFVHALLEGPAVRQPRALGLTSVLHDGRGWIGRVFLAVGAVLGLLLAGYTGMLAVVTNAPTWSHDPFLPAIFMASGVATGAAAMFLLDHLTAPGPVEPRARVLRMAALALGFELVLVLGSAIAGIGHVAPHYTGFWALLFWLVILPFGFLVPLALLLGVSFRGREFMPNAAVLGTLLVLVGGLLFRTFEVFGGQAYFVPY